MNNKPVLTRIIIVAIILGVFAYSMFPIRSKSPYKTLANLTNNNPTVEKVIKLAELKEKNNKDLYPQTAIEEAAKELNVELSNYVNIPNVVTNQDVLRIVRSKSASTIKLGLDLAGGIDFDVSVAPNKDNKVPIAQLRDRVMEILRNRINRSGLVEPEIAAEGSNRISIKIPVSTESQKNEYKKLIQMSAKLEFRLVAPNNSELLSQYQADPAHFIPPVGYEKMEMLRIDTRGKRSVETCFVQIHPQMTGENITNAQVVMTQYGQREITLEFNPTGAKEFGEVTGANVGQRLGIVLDGTLYSAPVINQAIYGGNAVIEGDFSQEEAKNVATALACGNLPATIKIDSTFEVAPTLGKEAVNSGMIAGILSVIAVAIFMLIYYLKAGIVANVALIVNVVLIMGAMASLGATLTLPGIAGILLTIGMVVDANVLIYERIREEITAGKMIVNAIAIGYKRAFITIFDSNLTTLMIALILYWCGSGPVKGFGITLSIGIASSMFTAIFITRLIFDIYTKYFKLHSLKMFKLLSNVNIPFLKLWKTCITISVILIASSILTIIIKHNNILSVDFTGGSQLVLNYKNYISQDRIHQTLADAGYETKVTYKSSPTEGDRLEIVISHSSKNASTGELLPITQLLNKDFPNGEFKGVQETNIGGLVGAQFAMSAIIAVLLSFVGMIIYVSLRFELTYALAAIIALLHDITIGTGVLVFCDRQISLTVIAALLTVMGYSVMDTIIVYDRIRENLTLHKDTTYRDIINLSINQTLSRTIITSFLTFLVVAVLFFFGGTAINDFALVMMVGIIVGTYSSIFVASPFVAYWHKKVTGIRE